jgi:DNA primase
VGTFLDEELLSYVALLPRGEDPDTFARQHGKDGVELLLSKALESVAYFCRYGWKKSGDSPIEAAQLVEEAAPIIRKVKNEAARQRYAADLAQQVGLPADAVWRQVRAGQGAAERPPQRSVETPAAPAELKKPATLSKPERELIALVADHPSLLQRLKPLGAFRAIGEGSLKQALTELTTREGSFKFDATALADALDPTLRSQVMEAAMSGRFAGIGEPEKALVEILRRFDAVGASAELKKALAEKRAAGAPEDAKRIDERINELNQQRLGLKG